MSSSTTVSPAADSGNGGINGPRVFDLTELETIFSIMGVAVDTPDNSNVKDEITKLLNDDWKVTCFSQLKVFSSDFVEEELATLSSLSPFQKSVFKKLAMYSLIGPLTAGMTMDELVANIQANEASKKSTQNISSGYSSDKKTIPDIKPFSGSNADFEEWHTVAKDTLGKAALLNAVTDPNYSVTNPSISSAVFYSLRMALRDGDALHYSEALDQAKTHDAYKLWEALEQAYSGALDKANTIVYRIRDLMSLRLEPGVTPQQFVNNYKTNILRLKSVNSSLANDQDFLRACLLIAIQDDDFDKVREEIVTDTSKSANEILENLLIRESSLHLKDSGADDGDTTRSARKVTFSKSTNKKYNGSGSNDYRSGSNTAWKVPFFPSSWKSAVGAKMWSFMLSWRDACHNKKIEQKKLNKDFDIDLKPMGGSSPTKYQKKKAKGRRTSKKRHLSEVDDDDDTPSDDGGLSSNQDNGNGGQQEFQIVSRRTKKTITTVTRRVARRSNTDYFSDYDGDSQVLIADSGCDQTLLTNVWKVVEQSDRTVIMTSPLAGRSQGQSFPVVHAVAKLKDRFGNEYCAHSYESLFDATPGQNESLLSVHQALRMKGNAIDDRSPEELRDTEGNAGTLSSRFGKEVLHFHYDGSKCFYEVLPISFQEMDKLPQVVLTDGTRPYEPFDRRLHSSLMTSVRRNPLIDINWKENLGFIPDEIVEKTKLATTQMVPTVEAETREIMKGHLKSRIPPELRLRHVNDIVCIDTFFSSVLSIRKYKCFNLFGFKTSHFDTVYLMRRRSQAPSTVMKCFVDCGVPHTVHSDNAPEFKSKKWLAVIPRTVKHTYTEPHHPNQNLAERRGGVLKHAVVFLLRVTNAPLDYWCYALEYIVEVRNFVARRSLDWRTPFERHFGETPDISKFRFPFWCPIWYYTPRESFPKMRMLKGRFIGFAKSQGDAFCYLIVTEPEDGSDPRHLTRSVIRRRYPRAVDTNEDPCTEKEEIIFFKENSKNSTTRLELPPTEDLSPDFISDIFDENAAPLFASESSEDPIDGDISAAKFEEAISEVYGPPIKRNRLSSDNPLDKHSSVPQEFVDSEELSPKSKPQDEDPIQEKPIVETVTEEQSPDEPMQKGINSDPPPQVTQDDEDIDPIDYDAMAHHFETKVDSSFEEELFESIVGHEFLDGILHFIVKWKTDEISQINYKIVRQDHPLAAARYILDNKIGSKRHVTGTHCRWARKIVRDSERILRRILRQERDCWSVGLNEDDGHPYPEFLMTNTTPVRLIRRTHTVAGVRKKKKTKPGRTRRPRKVLYGVEVPNSVKEALEMDRVNGNTFWFDAIQKEIGTLLRLKCFTFHSADYKPSADFNFAPLRMLFEVKHDGRRKARLVAGGHVIQDPGISARSTVVKGISVRLLDVIAHRDNLKILTGDVGNAFITADCLEKVWSRAGPEFGEREGSIVTLNKALYGLRTSSKAFRCHFGAFLRSLGFRPSKFDGDVWMKLRPPSKSFPPGYDYICTHVDDFKVVAENPQQWVDCIAKAFTLKESGPPKYYLGNDYHFDESRQCWTYGSKTYINECIRKIEADLQPGENLYKHRTSMPPGCHPELDESELLDDNGRQRYQQLIGMAQWAVTIGRVDISFAVSSLSRFSAAPRQGHLELSLHLFGYLRQYPNYRILVDSRPLIVKDPDLNTKHTLDPDFLDQYEIVEEATGDLPKAFGREIETSIFFDADHAHDQKTRRSISGIIVYAGRTPISWISRRQGCIASSTYCAEFLAMRLATEEAISLRYMLRCLGVPVKSPTKLFGDNKGSIQSANIPDGELKKKHIAISYHFVREHVASQIIQPIWIHSASNFADMCTKALGKLLFTALSRQVMLPS